MQPAAHLLQRRSAFPTYLEIAAELKKVTWPTLRETRAATVARISSSVVGTFVVSAALIVSSSQAIKKY